MGRDDVSDKSSNEKATKTDVVKRSSLRLAEKSTGPKEAPQASVIPTKRAKVDLPDPTTRKDEEGHSSCLLGSIPARKCKSRKNLKTLDLNRSESKGLESISPSSKDILYQVKWICHKGRNIPIVTQNENGPCPLISIINILSLQNRLKIKDTVMEMTEEELILTVNTAILESVSKIENPNPNLMQNAQDAISLLPEIISGLNVNIKFCGVKSFEYTRECLIFDVLRIPLYHGWLLDPQSAEVARAVGNLSYNQLIDQIIEKKTSDNPDTVAEALVAENFLDSTASQLTVHGLCELNESLEDGEFGILFRNNHFNVITKTKNTLCQLVTDQGYLEEPTVIWETLSTISGDEVFLDSSFKNSISQRSVFFDADEEQQISQDFLVALSLQDEQTKQQDKEFDWGAYGNDLGAIGIAYDEEIARHLQVEERRKATLQSEASSVDESTSSAKATQTTSDEGPKTRGWKCTIC